MTTQSQSVVKKKQLNTVDIKYARAYTFNWELLVLNSVENIEYVSTSQSKPWKCQALKKLYRM